MLLVTETELVARVRFEAELENAESPSDAQIQTKLRAAARKLWRKVRAKTKSPFVQKGTAVTVDGTATVALPARFAQLLAVRLRVSAGNVVNLAKAQDVEVSGYQSGTGSVVKGLPERWRYVGMFAVDGSTTPVEQLELFPTPNGAYTVEVDYVPAFDVVTSGTVSYDCANGLDDYVVYSVAADVANREDEPKVALLAAKAAEALADAIEAEKRRIVPPGALVDVYNDLPRPAVWGRVL